MVWELLLKSRTNAQYNCTSIHDIPFLGMDCNHKRRMFIPSVNTIAFWDFTSFQLFNYILLPPNYWIHCAVPGLSTQQCNRIKFVTHICKENNTFKNETKHQLVGGWVSVYSVNGIDVIISIETVWHRGFFHPATEAEKLWCRRPRASQDRYSTEWDPLGGFITGNVRPCNKTSNNTLKCTRCTTGSQ